MFYEHVQPDHVTNIHVCLNRNCWYIRHFHKQAKLATMALTPTWYSHMFATFFIRFYFDLKILVNMKLDVSWLKGLSFKVADFIGLSYFK